MTVPTVEVDVPRATVVIDIATVEVSAEASRPEVIIDFAGLGATCCPDDAPTGDGQVLTWDATTSDTVWADLPAAADPLPGGATDGQVLTWDDTTDAAEWADPAAPLPGGATNGQVLTWDTASGAAEWATPEPVPGPLEWSTTTTIADPGAGRLRANNATILLSTDMAVSATDADGDVLYGLSMLVKGDSIYIISRADRSDWLRWRLTGPAWDNGTWVELPGHAIDNGGDVQVAFTDGLDVEIMIVTSSLPPGMTSIAPQHVAWDPVGNDWQTAIDPPPVGAWFKIEAATNRLITVGYHPTYSSNDFELISYAAAERWTTSGITQALVSHWDAPANQRRCTMTHSASGALNISVSQDGTGTIFSATASLFPPFTDGRPIWEKATYRHSDGRVQFFYSLADASFDPLTGPWTQLGTDRTLSGAPLPGNLFQPTAAEFEIGGRSSSSPVIGRIGYAAIRDGIGGPVIAGIDLRRRYTSIGLAGAQWTIAGDGQWGWVIAEDSVPNLKADLAGLYGTAPKVDMYTTPGTYTWTKPAGAVRVEVCVIGSGAGGASGRRGAASSVRPGGGGGSGGARQVSSFLATDLGVTETVIVGAGGAGGAAVTANDTSGNIGTAGNDSYFGSPARWLTTLGGNQQPLQTATTGPGSSAAYAFSSIGQAAGANGAAGASGNLGTSKANSNTAGGGASGGGITTGDAVSAGGNGSAPASGITAVPVGGTAGGGTGGNGQTAKAGNTSMPGGSGAGGGSSITGNGGDGGNGGWPGGGGGGGGAALNGFNSGKGGNGADGCVVVTSYFASGSLPATPGETLEFTYVGTPAAYTSEPPVYNDAGRTWTIKSIRVSVAGAPTSTMTFDVTLAGVSVWSATPANRPQIASGQTTVKKTDMDTVAVPDGTAIRAVIATAGAGATGPVVWQIEMG